MNADLVGALEQLERSWKAFEHKGKPMTKEQVRKVLVYGIQKGYTHTGQLSDDEVDIAIGKSFPCLSDKNDCQKQCDACRYVEGEIKKSKHFKCKCGFESNDSYGFTVHLDCCAHGEG